MLDLLIKHATIIDGTSSPAQEGNVGVREGKIVFPVGEDTPAHQVIEAKGLLVCPGFIDAHSHGDTVLGFEYARQCKTSQGITTEICGQCGMSPTPVDLSIADEFKLSMSSQTKDFPENLEDWATFENYLKYAQRVPKTANFKQFIGHSTLRIAAMGFANRPATAEELERMKALLKDAMERGAAGLSTGLIYTPSCYATTDEIVELAKVIAPYGGIYASHMRNESSGVVDAVKEVLEIGRRAGVAVWISHHKILGRDNWGLQKETLKLLDEAEAEGLQVTCDQYPYNRNMTTLSACMPPWYFDQGMSWLLNQLGDPAFRAKVRKEMEDPATPYDNYYRNAGGWPGVLVTWAENLPQAEGKSIAEYAQELGQDPFDVFFDVLLASKGTSMAVYSSMCDEDVFEIAKSKHTVVGTDGTTRSLGEKGHPRSYGTFPHAINYYVKQNHIMSLEEMIHRMTLKTAVRHHIDNKGAIRDGYDADLLVIDYDRFEDKATYTDATAMTEGLEYVIVGGEIVMRDKVMTGAAPGKFIPHRP